MYKEQILAKDFSNIDEYMKAWSEFQDLFLSQSGNLEKYSSISWYKIWWSFSQEKINDGWSRIERKVNMKSGLKEKQMEVEIDKYKTMMELKSTNPKEIEGLQSEIHFLREETRKYQKREKELKDEVIACRELLDSKDEEIDTLNEKVSNMRRQRDKFEPPTINLEGKGTAKKSKWFCMF